jgi:PST family polysaccharide transporter
VNHSRGKASSKTISWMAWTGASRVILLFVSIASVAVLARLLTQEDYGIFTAALIFVSIAQSGFVQGGFPAAIIQRQELTNEHIRNAYTGSLVIHIVAAAAIFLAADLIAEFFAMPALALVLQVMCLTVVIDPLLSMSRALLQRRKRFRIMATSDVITTIIANTVVAIALAYAGFGVWALVIANVTLSVLQTAVAFGWARFNPIPFISSHMRDLLSVSLGFSLAGALSIVSNNAARFIIGRVLGADALGVFSRANRVLAFPVMVLGSSNVLFPVMAGMNDDRERVARGYLRANALCALAALPLTVLLVHGAEAFIFLLLGERWMDAAVPTQILAMTLVFGLGIKMATVVFMALGKPAEIVTRQIAFASVITVGSIAGSRWGINGVCVAVLVANVTCFFLSIHLANRLLDIAWMRFARTFLPALLLALPILLVLILGHAFIWHDAPKYLVFPIEAVVSGAVFYVLCLIWPDHVLGSDGLWLLSEVRSRVPGPLRRLIPARRT